MPNNKKTFDDVDFTCKRCRAHLATEKLDRQVLVFDNVALYNFCVISCLACEKINVWQSPNLLRGENESLDRRFPDKASDLPKPDKRIVNQLGIKGVTRTPNGKYKVRVIIDGETKYLGCYSSVSKASAAYEKAKTGCISSTKNRNDFYKQSENQNT
jgi:hypothetical protein